MIYDVLEKDLLVNDSGEQESNICIKNKKLKLRKTIKKKKLEKKQEKILEILK